MFTLQMAISLGPFYYNKKGETNITMKILGENIAHKIPNISPFYARKYLFYCYCNV